MFSFFQRGPAFGIEITSERVRTVSAAAGHERNRTFAAVTTDLPAGAAADTYSLSNIADPSGVSRALLQSLPDRRDQKGSRAGLCLPDALFRIQTLDFDELPARAPDQERLIRWRLEKTAAFDLADTVLRHQVLRRVRGVTVLVCIAKRTVIAQYEAVLADAGLEAWSVAPSSFGVANFYAPSLAQRSRFYALSHVTGDSIATLVTEQGAVGFYRFKELKRGSTAEICGRAARDIADSLHFYTHRDRTQQADLRHLYLNGDAALCEALAGDLGTEESLEVHLLTPGQVLSGSEAGPDYAAAFGAAGMVL